MSETIYVSGHKNPDNDSICSAIAAAYMHNIIASREQDKYSDADFPEYVPIRLGPLPPESAWVLAQQGFEPPILLDRIEPNQKIVLVDHNEPQQAIDGIEYAEIVEVVDHHRVSGLKTAKPVKMVFMTWGCTCTILAKMYEAYHVPITQQIATVMLAAILTDTVIMKSPTTTDMDREVIDQLSHLAHVDPIEFGLQLFKQRGGEETMDVEKLVAADSKEFQVKGKTVLIAQRETVDVPTVMAREKEIRVYMRDRLEKDNYDFVLLLVTDIMKEGSLFLVEGNREPVESTFNITCQEGGTWMPGVLSRKKQVAAPLLEE